MYKIFMCTGRDGKIVSLREKLAMFFTACENTKTNHSLKFVGYQKAYHVIIFTLFIYFTKVVNLLKILES